MIQQMSDGNSAEAGETFNDIMMGKITDVLDTTKRKVAAAFFGIKEESEEEPSGNENN